MLQSIALEEKILHFSDAMSSFATNDDGGQSVSIDFLLRDE